MLTILLAAVLALGPVIIFHEFGHFIVAKLAGIYVKTFSVGFGPKLLRARLGETEYCISALPLGGYVRMAGESVEVEAPAAEIATAVSPPPTGEAALYPRDGVLDADIPPHRYLRSKPILTRLAVVTAGPFANLLLAVVVLTLSLHHDGMPYLSTTTLDGIAADSPEAQAGLRDGDAIVAIDGQPVTTTLEVSRRLQTLGSASFPLVVRRNGADTTLVIAGVRREHGNITFPAWSYRPEARIGTVKKDGPAARAGLQTGDRIVEVDGEAVLYYDELAKRVNASIDKPLHLVWDRDGRQMQATVIPEASDAPDPKDPNKVVRVGRIQVQNFQQVAPVGWGVAISQSLDSTWYLMRAMLNGLWVAIQGKASRDSVGGPIRIAQEAASELRWGLGRLFQFMAFLSVNLFLINMLPVPVLDGGHVLFLLIEAVRGEALSTRVQELALRVGVSALIALMGLIVVLDLVRVINH